MTPNDAFEFFVELVSRLFHADLLITEHAERIEVLEAEGARLEAAPEQTPGAAAYAALPGSVT